SPHYPYLHSFPTRRSSDLLDDYQHAFENSPAIQRLKEKAEVQILTEKLATEAAIVRALKDSQAVIPIRERTKFPAPLLQALPDRSEEHTSELQSRVDLVCR